MSKPNPPGPTTGEKSCSAVGCPGVRRLRKQIEATAAEHGISLDSPRRDYVRQLEKSAVRQLNHIAVATLRRRARGGLERHEERLIQRFADGRQVDPSGIQPRLVEVHPGSEEELLFRYARLHWSIPVSAGYGRRLRYLIIDEHKDKLIGLFGLGDPVFAIAPRDRWIGWDKTEKKEKLRHVMDPVPARK